MIYKFGDWVVCDPGYKTEIAKAPAGIGYHRFDATCPKRDEECCYMCGAVRADD